MTEERQDISEVLLVLDGISGMLQEIIKELVNPYIKNFLGWHILYPLMKALPEWVKTEHHKLKAYNGFSIKVN